MSQPRIFAARYVLLTEQTEGGTATLHKAFDQESHAVVALKVFTEHGRDPAIVSEIWHREHSALGQLSHDCIIRMLDAGRCSLTNKRYIALEWIDGQTLEQHLAAAGPLEWPTFYERYGEPILAALTYAAERNIAHRDLSTGNVLIAPTGAVKIIDFGQAKLASVGIGRTLMGWRTVPYCLPEEDTGTYTLTRDPYAFCAIAVRAMAGHALANHEELYAALPGLALPPGERAAIVQALSRTPGERFGTIIEFAEALRGVASEAHDQPGRLRIALRFIPSVTEQLRPPTDAEGSPQEQLLAELSEVAAVSAVGAAIDSTIAMETQSFRLAASLDRSREHLVVTSLVRKRFRLDALFQSDRWLLQADFTDQLPRRATEQQIARRDLQALYAGLDAHLHEVSQAQRHDPNHALAEWSNLLEALRHIARNGVPPLRYKTVDRDGARLLAIVENPEDAVEEQLRVISVSGTWVFRGEVESVRGAQCVLLSTRPHIDLERIPGKGTLDIDWAQTRVALDRQARALDKFKANETPGSRLRALLVSADSGPTEPSYEPVARFFDRSLDDAKKAVVSRFAAGADLIVTHGPPGTGKTKLIVELIRQELARNPDARILLASQTHVALDNALERLLGADRGISCVRIGSGSKEADPRVEACYLDQRSLALRDQVTVSSQRFLQERAAEMGIDRHEVELGLAVLDLIGAREQLARVQASLAKLEAEAQALEAEIAAESALATRERSDKLLRAGVLEDELERIGGDDVVARSTVEAARQKLLALGKDGIQLATHSDAELREWSQLLLGDPQREALGQLMTLSEDWRMRFGQSEDFKAAIISFSSVVAGTCVGFCREEAALRTVFDLCIVDEAGKATTTELLVPLAQSRRAVLLGDHHQLPAVLDQALQSEELQERFGLSQQQLDEQLFERLTKDLGDGCKAVLTEQHRMRGEIGRLVSRCFYDDNLSEGASTADRDIADLSVAGLDREVTWLDPYAGANKAYEERARGTSYENAREAQAIVALLKRLLFALERSGRPSTAWPTIGIISGYAPQVTLIRTEIRKERDLDRLIIDCASVHAFQGREVDICIYSVTRKNNRSQIGMLSDWRHLNVALSRARDFLVIVGDLEFCRTVRGKNPFARLIKFVEEESVECVIKEWDHE
ncbi:MULTISPECIES: AAA domain-containing protein [unclassified Lysobacter]|uniref:AAA domain-containing protein n=1 Tax=unclassified Lysobacter TaxID=2635362 RepID=UPI001BE9C935|nr:MULTISPECIES: AAA domain-containing protein [unclassified Lysobacter]MBT2744906.1 protein kinase [Lysobacter sp. ISL-42]MBT2752101.1 protein kinase [Lysobacter sp. ISL-50]MBT2778598.1 protein kinase [Lysobacter sp. ISL-54]MBT2780471.1 protein kinase [Lysobacter sp. ISL-52]